MVPTGGSGPVDDSDKFPLGLTDLQVPGDTIIGA